MSVAPPVWSMYNLSWNWQAFYMLCDPVLMFYEQQPMFHVQVSTWDDSIHRDYTHTHIASIQIEGVNMSLMLWCVFLMKCTPVSVHVIGWDFTLRYIGDLFTVSSWPLILYCFGQRLKMIVPLKYWPPTYSGHWSSAVFWFTKVHFIQVDFTVYCVSRVWGCKSHP